MITKMILRYPPNPCRDCQDRHVGCHSECAKHNEWQRLKNEEQNKFQSAYASEFAAHSYKVGAIERARKNKKNNHRPGVPLSKFAGGSSIVDPNFDTESYK